MPPTTFLVCPRRTQMSPLVTARTGGDRTRQPFQRRSELRPEAHADGTVVAMTTPVATEALVNGLGGLPETLTCSFPKSSIRSYGKWPKSKLLLLCKNLNMPIADLNFSLFSYKKFFYRTTKYQIFIVIKCQDNLLIKLRLIIVLLLKYPKI